MRFPNSAPAAGAQILLSLSLLLLSACGRSDPQPPSPEPVTLDPHGWGTHVLAWERAPDGAVWIGTYGEGIHVSLAGDAGRRQIRSAEEDSASISWDFVNAFAFPPDGSVWYGTVGNGFGRSTDAGRTWRNWTFDDLGPEWQYVAPAGIRAHGDTVAVATADGLRLTWDGGETWRCIQAVDAPSGGAEGHDDRCSERVLSLPTEYLLSLDIAPDGALWVGHLRGISVSHDGGRRWLTIGGPRGVPRGRVRGIAATAGAVWAATEHEVYRGRPDGSGFEPAEPPASLRDRLAATATARALRVPGDAPAAEAPRAPLHTWFARPIDGAEANPHIDQTYRYGSTMGGNFQQHQGVEFNNPAGAPVRAIGDGIVVFAGTAEAGSNTVAILHDRRWEDRYVFSTYYHNTSLDVAPGQRVRAGDRIARVGNTGRATNDHLHLEIHVAPPEDSAAVVAAEERFPPYTANPQLWIEPLPGTGIVAGRVLDAAGEPVAGARIYGLAVEQPEETPFSFAEAYRENANPDPAYGEHFAVGDVPAGEYVVGTEIGGERVWRRVVVEPGRVTWLELTP